jgi:hypothetical protein
MLTDSLLAYIDPSSGTILLQALIAGALGLVWRVTSLFRRKRAADEQPVMDATGAAHSDSGLPSA